MLSYFYGLGMRVEQEWLLLGYDESRFPELASRALREDPPLGSVTLAEIVDWMFDPIHPVPQPPWNVSAIGQPSLVLYSTTRFMIEALFWFDATTSIHQHAFSGAFTVLHGSSVHSQWSFTEHRRLSSGLRTGELALGAVEVLHAGQARTITAGSTYIHQLFHLEMPSVTIVVRTRREEEHSPQFVYFLPGLALDPQTDDVLLPRRLALLDGMLRAPMGDAVRAAGKLLVQGDMRTVYRVLQHMARRNLDQAGFDALCTIARERHGEVIDLFLRAIEIDRRESYVIACRQRFLEPRHRFLLALLLLVPDRKLIDTLLAAEYPDQAPEEFIMASAKEMSGLDTIGIELDELNSLLFRCLLEGLDEEGTLERLAVEYDADDVRQQRDSVLIQRRRIAGSELFAPLFGNLRPGTPAPRDPSTASILAAREEDVRAYVARRRRHVRGMEAAERTSDVYLRNMDAAQQEFERLLATDDLTPATWLDGLRQRHRMATGVDSGEGHVGSGAYRSNDERFIHAGLMRDEVIEAGLMPAERLDFQNRANPLIGGELQEWLRRTGRAAPAVQVEVRGVKDHFDGLGPAAQASYGRATPINDGAHHYFPHPTTVAAYRRLATERLVEAWTAVKHAAGALPGSRAQRDAIRALADYYHTVINGHLFVRVNNSLVMTEVNSLLKHMGLKEVEHGHLDIFAFNLGYSDFRDYFEEFVGLGQHSLIRYDLSAAVGCLVRVPLATQ
jgi:hypothetical protein